MQRLVALWVVAKIPFKALVAVIASIHLPIPVQALVARVTVVVGVTVARRVVAQVPCTLARPMPRTNA